MVKKKLRILIADDHTMIREGLIMLINGQPDMEIIGEAADGREAVEKARKAQPDVVVMDMSMPDMDGGRATEILKKACPSVKVLALTAHEEKQYLREILKAGGSGYLLKRVAAEELAHAIRAVAAGDVYIDPKMAGSVVEGYLQKASQPQELPGVHLSDRETEVLRLLAWGHSNREIADQLYIGVRTVETYKARVMQKLDLKSRVDIVRYALHRGWLDEESGE